MILSTPSQQASYFAETLHASKGQLARNAQRIAELEEENDRLHQIIFDLKFPGLLDRYRDNPILGPLIKI